MNVTAWQRLGLANSREEDSKWSSELPSAWVRVDTSPTDTVLAVRAACVERRSEDRAWAFISRANVLVDCASKEPDTSTDGPAKNDSIPPLVSACPLVWALALLVEVASSRTATSDMESAMLDM